MSFYIAKGQNLNFALPVEWIAELPQRHAQFRERDEKIDKCREFLSRADKHPFIEELLQNERFNSWDKEKQRAFVSQWLDTEYEESERLHQYPPEKRDAFKQWYFDRHIPDPAWECY